MNEKFKKALKSVSVPILTLDNKWHKLFRRTEETREMKEMEASLTALMEEEARLNSELKDLKKIKHDLMEEIVSNMNGTENASNKAAQKKLADSKRLLGDANDRIDDDNDRLKEIPAEIEEINRELMLITMEECYDFLKDNTAEIEEIDKWINETRVELKRNILRKQHLEVTNVELYSYMEDIFGPKVMDLFEISYDIPEKKRVLLEKQEALKEQKKLEEAKSRAAKNIAEGKNADMSAAIKAEKERMEEAERASYTTLADITEKKRKK